MTDTTPAEAIGVPAIIAAAGEQAVKQYRAYHDLRRPSTRSAYRWVQSRQCQVFRRNSSGIRSGSGLNPSGGRSALLERRRPSRELGVTKPPPPPEGTPRWTMLRAVTALLATPFAAALLPLTIRLLPVITRIGTLIVHFRHAEPTPQPATSSRPNSVSNSANSAGSSSNGPTTTSSPHDRA